eukprot:529098_1
MSDFVSQRTTEFGYVSQRMTSSSDPTISCIGVVSAIAILGPSIAALVVGIQYPADSICNDEEYTIDLKDFLVIAGGAYIGWFCLGCFIMCCGALCCSERSQLQFKLVVFAVFACPLLIWSLAWAIIGLIIYDQQMSGYCQTEPIGQMICAWSAIQITLIGAACCIMACPR